MQFVQGERVKHPNKPDWGVGQILADSFDDTVRVFFVGIGEKTLKLQHANLVKIDGEEAFHPMLDNLKTVKKSKSVKFRNLKSLIEVFLRKFPDGFRDSLFHKQERDYKIEAHKLMLDSLGANDFAALLGTQQYEEICNRAGQVINKTNLIFPNEKMSLKDGLKIDSNKAEFSKALFSLLYDETELESRFEKFSDCLSEIKAAKWTIQTYFLFITFPEGHIFLKPEVTQKAAEACGFELHYRSEINWQTYSKLWSLRDICSVS